MKKVVAFLKRLVGKSAAFIRQWVRPSIETVELLKNAVNSPVTSFLTAIIPGTVDDAIAAGLKQWLPVVLQVLGYTEECMQAKTGDEFVQCAIRKLRVMHPDAQAAAYHNIASLLSHYLSDGKLSWSEALHLAEATYTELKGK
jgi:hypothetical protein